VIDSPTRAAALPLIPLALAVAALAVREIARPGARPPVEPGVASELVVPRALLAMTAQPWPERSFDTAPEGSRAWVSAGSDGISPATLRGTVRMLADGGLDGLDLVLDEPAAPLRIRGGRTPASASSVPGFRTGCANVRIERGDASSEAWVDLAWLATPVSGLRIHGVFREPPDVALGAGEPRQVLAIDLALH
jgi:hypothetical protein